MTDQPRATDPHTSVNGIAPNVNKHWEQLLEVAHSVPQPFTDTDLHAAWETQVGRVDRGVIARTRLRLEQKGMVERLPLADDDRNLKFRMVYF